MEALSMNFEEKKALCESITLEDILEYIDGSICEAYILHNSPDTDRISGRYSELKLIKFNKNDYDYVRTNRNQYIEPSNSFCKEFDENQDVWYFLSSYYISKNKIKKCNSKDKAVKMVFNSLCKHVFFHIKENEYLVIQKVVRRDKNAFKYDLLEKLTYTSLRIENIKKYLNKLKEKENRLKKYVDCHNKIYGVETVTVIYAYAEDTDTELLEGIWKGLKNVTVVKITKDSKNYENIVNDAIKKEKGTLIFAGHGTPYGLLHPNFASNRYLLHENNKYLIKASKVICIWCFASEFVKDNNILNSFSTSMYISNINEAYDYNMYNESSRAIQKITEDFCADVNNLLKNKVDLKEWHDIIVQKTDTNSRIDTFNRTNTFINVRN